MLPESKPLQLPQFVDERRVSPFQYGVIILCGLVMFLDGFDTQAISYMAPYIAQEWSLSKPMLGPIFSSSLAGLMVGYLVLTPLSERFGHKKAIIVSTIVFSLCTLASVWATNVTELMVLRFITGIGLGAAAPSAIAMTGEYSPKRLRATFVLAIYCGFSLGFIAAGLAAGWFIPHYGWRSMFWVGGLAPLMLVPVLFRFLPESMVFMIKNKVPPQQILSVFRKIDASVGQQSKPVFVVEALEQGQHGALASLFTRDRIMGTVLLWLVFAINLGEFYALQSWLPSIMTGLNYPMSTVVMATTLTTVGGIAAAFITGPSMDRLGAYKTVGILYLVGFVFVALTGMAFNSPLWVLLSANFLAGCCISGGQKSLIALAAVFYPAPMRSTGVGWALGIGRIGGIAGPIVVGAALGIGWSPSAVFYGMAIPMLIAGLLVLFLGRRYGNSNKV
ncbi:MFS transporter [Pseudomonas stutzeri]|jgi:AAHS family 4-hydroxybenzoate transporter-like MFS transporter|uniref:MFS transporter n=1 Tax=Stutzerimonas stutzeri group TaxID=136846 RepID=UPI001AAE78C8|nr:MULTISPECIES: MFS transporter [Stutzerimonas stutzeri group]MCC8345295.1 MFS transporter [Stutzerimonas stutzeri]QTF59201.1 MFS transporter [Stutzerimonas frequens]HCF1642818.1 MFS transporter [Pseudomonas aeruginosa]